MRRHLRLRALVPGLLISSLAGFLHGCDSTNPPAMEPPPDCSGTPLTVIVGPGLAPTFSWTPDCQVGMLLVEDSSTADMWAIGTPLDTSTVDRNTIQSVVTYGTVPPGAIEQRPLVPLAAGASYTVYLSVNNPNGSVSLYGVQAFTP